VLLHPQKPAHAQEGDCPYESYAVWCDDGIPLDGYWWQDSLWIPGLITVDTWFTPTPALATGKAAFYYPGLMKATAEYRGLDLDGYVDGVSLMTCADIGFEVWIQRPGHAWEGPYLSVDCARRGDLYGVVAGRGEVIEVSWKTAQRWGMVTEGGKIEQWNIPDVRVSKVPPEDLWDTPQVVLQDWFLDTVRFDCCSVTPPALFYTHPRTWSINGVVKTFSVPIPARPTPTSTPFPTPTLQESDYGAIVIREPDEKPPETIQQEEQSMFRHPFYRKLFILALIAILSLVLMAFQVIDNDRIEEVITAIVGFVIMLLGPKPLRALYDLLKIPGGAWRVFATYVASGIVGVVALLIAGAFTAITFDAETLLAMAGLLATAAQMAYHHLKDLYGPALSAP